MKPAEYTILFCVFMAVLAFVFFGRTLIDTIVEAFNNFRGGGPPTPMHPSPSGDAALLRKRLLSKSPVIRAGRK